MKKRVMVKQKPTYERTIQQVVRYLRRGDFPSVHVTADPTFAREQSDPKIFAKNVLIDTLPYDNRPSSVIVRW